MTDLRCAVKSDIAVRSEVENSHVTREIETESRIFVFLLYFHSVFTHSHTFYSVCTLYLVFIPSLHFIPGLQSAVCTPSLHFVLSLHFIPVLHTQCAFYTQSALYNCYAHPVCILYSVCTLYLVCTPSLHFILSPQSAFCARSAAVCSLHFVLTGGRSVHMKEDRLKLGSDNYYAKFVLKILKPSREKL